ncbi:wd-40 repeat protein : Uncultured bacterium genome assembly Metasoil_fosmids_resub OS=uncultured bacterium PE=4 SV=1: Sigma70_r2: Sigma70_r4_2: WD40: PD40: WD40: WD40: WD40 [Gemmata massiliana]|uniref:Uncharacterized protein n=1 Tax=Gemmata massiliana TaxID=1210884 RepID=A0A6P2CWG4_9BACT|nr:sigma-70 family RNA polymerase sigma factor [Gemmata massiliana]VTR92495.1 wd-40 repeat protein : Uncultured bacterium genome assembly Metasoil_fosmids_resub OS=uncultured bacterium PE=4 SV=1: Sigma70_r2: Sigma70_r4_2: WD40: PD40: WD40: WD40: WD40 [Gemmata massiliana]
MSTPETGRLMREVQNLIGDAREDVPDGDLVARFVDRRDESAFECLVRRYSRLVFGVCRRVLVDPNAADDAFQATFLVLVHRAAAIDRSRPVSDWLYTVAFRLACRARANAARRQRLEATGAQFRPVIAPPCAPEDGHTVLHEELNRLPEQYRVPLVLSYLEGRTYEQVAQAIGCPVGSVGWRLTRAREALRVRLTSRGVVCPAAGVATLIASAGTGTAAPAPLFDTTVRAGLWFAGRSADGTVHAAPSAQVLELARGTIGTMTTSKWVAAAVVLAVGLCGGTAWLARSAAMSAPPPTVADQPAPTAKPAKLSEVPDGASARMGTAQFRHGDVVFFIAYTADGKGIVTAGRDNTVRLWDRTTGQVVRQFERAEGKKEPLAQKPAMPAMSGKMMSTTPPDDFPVALAPDGKTLAAGKDRTITVWETATGKKLPAMTTTAEVTELEFTPDGRALVSADANGAVVLWNPVEGTARKTFEPKADGKGATKTGAAVSPTGTHVVQQLIEPETANGSLRITELATGTALPDIKLSVGGAQNIAFSPDGKYLAWASFTDGITVWDVGAHKEVNRFGSGTAMKPRFFGKSLRIAADNKTVAVTLSNDAIELWDVTEGKLKQTVGGYTAEPSGRVAVRIVRGGGNRMISTDLALAPDGKTVAVSLGSAAVRQFDVETGKEIAATPGHLSGIMAVGSDGKTVVTVSRESVRVWDLAGGAVRHWALTPPATSVAVAPDAKFVATSSGKGVIRMWDAARGEPVREIDTKRGDVAGIAFSPDGKRLATKAELNSAVNLWDATTGAHVRTIGQDGEPVFSGGRVTLDISGMQTPVIRFSPDGRLIAAASDKKQLRVWDAATGTVVCDIAAPKSLGVAFEFSANGHVLALLTQDGTVTGYEIATGEKRFVTRGAGDGSAANHPRDIAGGTAAISALGRGFANAGAIGFTADGRFLFSAAGTSGLRAWDTLTGQEIGHLKGHSGSVSHLCVANGGVLVTGSVDTTALTWNLSKLARVELTRDTPLPAGDLDQLWADLAKPDPAVALTAARKLLTGRKQAVTYLSERLRPVPVVEDARITELVTDLGGNFNARRKATAELERLGAVAAPHLRKALEGTPPLDLKQRVEALLQKAIVSKLTEDQLRDLRTVEVLEQAATPEATRVLETLAKGAKGARLTLEASAALARLTATK